MSEYETQLDHDERGFRYYRNAVERHWDPHEIELDEDRKRLHELAERLDEEYGDEFDDDDNVNIVSGALALFGAGEEAVTEDLAPLAVVLDDIEDEMFITTQLYEEAKHADFFDRYWNEVINPVEEAMGEEQTSPKDEKWFSEPYNELFDRNEEAMHRLLEEDTPENRVKAYTHYHLTIEGILAQTGYWGLTKNFDGSREDLPELPGLVEGIKGIRSDEGRHVGFGMAKVKHYINTGQVDESVMNETLGELIQLVQNALAHLWEDIDEPDRFPGLNPDELATYAAEKHTQRMGQIVDSKAEVPEVDELTALD